MQSNIIEPSSLPELPKPGPLDYWVLENPLAPAVVLAVAGLMVLYLLRHRNNYKRIGIPIGLILLALGAGIYTLGTMHITQREHLQQRSVDLVMSVADADSVTLRSMLDPNCTLSSVFASTEGADRIVQIATSRNPGVVQSAEVKRVNAGIYSDRVAVTQIRVRTQGSMVPSLSWWKVDWQRQSLDQPWVATFIEPIWIQGMSNPAGSN
jgi:hypothetical protein